MSEQDDRDIEQLLAKAGPRTNPPEEMRARVYASTLAAWEALPETQTITARSSGAGVAPWLAAAAVALLTLAGSLAWRSEGNPEAPVAKLAFLAEGMVTEPIAINGVKRGGPGLTLIANSEVATAAGVLATLEFASGAQLTLDEHSRLRVFENRVELDSGRIYVDAEGARQLVVQTEFLTVRDVGTQFEVGLDENAAAWVALREGYLDVVSASVSFSMQAVDGAGELVRFADARVVEREVVASTDPRWQWRTAGRAPFVLNGASVYDYLNWMARDSGHVLQFASRAVEQMARVETLVGYGNSDETEISDALSTTRFTLTPGQGGVWQVEFRGG